MNMDRTNAQFLYSFPFMQSVLESSPIPIIALDIKGKVMLWNNAAVKTFGWEKSEIVGKFYPEFEQIILEKDVVDFKTKRKHKNGSMINVSISSSIWKDTEGNVLGSIQQIIDLSEKAMVEEKVKESEERYHGLFDSIRDAILVADTDRNIINCNPAFRELFGYSLEEILGKKTLSVYENDEQFDKLGKELKDHYTDNLFLHFINYKRKDGSVFPGETAVYYLRDAENNVTGFIGLIRDISDRIKTETELIESEQRFRNIFEDNLAPMLVIDPHDGLIIDVNPAAEKYYGWNRNEFTKMKINQINTLPPKDVKQALINAKNLKRSNFEFKHRRADGSIRDVEVLSSQIKIKGKKFLHSIIHDISERKQAEAALRKSEENFYTTLYSIGDAVISTDVNGNIALMNPVAEKLCGWNFKDAKGKSLTKVFKIVNALTREKIDNPVKLVIETGNRIGLANHTVLISRDGTEYQISDSAAPIMGKDGKITGVVLVFTDVTEDYAIRKALKESEANLVKGELLGRFGYWEIDLLANTIKGSQGASEIYGLETAALDFEIGKKIPLPKYRKLLDESLHLLVTENKPYDIEFEIERPNGEIRIVHSTAQYDPKRKIVFGILHDITERKRSIEALRKSEQEYREFFMKDLTGDFLSTIEGGVIDCNPAYLRILGYKSIDDIKYYPTTNIYISPKDREEFINLIRANGEVTNYELRLRRTDGREITVIENVIGIFDDNGNLTHLRGYMFDITDRKIAEEKFQHVHSLLYSIRNINQLIVTEKNLDVLCKKSCEILKESRGYSAVWIGLTEDKQKFDNFYSVNIDTEFENLTAQMLSGELPGCFNELSFENPLKKDDVVEDYCRDCPLLARRLGYGTISVLIKHTNHIYGVLYIITKEINLYSEEEKSLLLEVADDLGFALYLQKESMKRSEAEERYGAIEKSAKDAIVTTDSNGLIIGWNPAASRIFEYSESEALNKSMDLVISPEYKKMGEERFEKDNSANILGKTVTINGLRKSGQIFPMELSLSEWESSGKKYFTGIIRDITERKKGEEELINAKEKAEVADKIKTEFLAQMSHEIRSPLNAVLSFTGIVKEMTAKIKSEELDVSFTAIESASRRIIRTIDSILNMADLQLGNYHISERKIDLVELLKNLKREYTSIAESKKLELRLLSKNKQVEIETDDYAVNQIFANLIDNAIKYTNEGYVEISVIIDDKIKVEVEDTGIGISEEYLPLLFTAFSQEEQGYTRNFEGNGLGMALVKKYCDLINADISVKSIKGKGTKFIISFNK